MGVNGSIKFRECQIFCNVNHFREVFKEHNIKHDYHLKRHLKGYNPSFNSEGTKEVLEILCVFEGLKGGVCQWL